MMALTRDEAIGLRRLRDLRVIDAPDTELSTKMYHGLVERGFAKMVGQRPGYVRLRLIEASA